MAKTPVRLALLGAAGRALAAAAIAMALGIGAPALAQTEDELIAALAARDAALAARDPAAIDSATAEALRLAEAVLGDSVETATLAYELALHRLGAGDFAGARAAAVRAAALAAAVSEAAFYGPDVEVLLARVDFAESRKDAAAAEAFRTALDAAGAAGAAASPNHLRAWIELANAEYAAERWTGAETAYAAAESLLVTYTPADAAGISRLALFQGRTRMKTRPVNLRAVSAVVAVFTAALDHFDRAYSTAPKTGLGNPLHPARAEAAAWRSALEAALQTLDPDAAEARRAAQAAAKEAQEAEPDPDPTADPDCREGAWATRPAPDYGSVNLREGYVGAVIVSYDIDAAGAVTDARVVAEVPAALFGPQALAAVRTGRIDVGEGLAEVCRRNRHVDFNFVLE